jgi:hypothetical protein
LWSSLHHRSSSHPIFLIILAARPLREIMFTFRQADNEVSGIAKRDESAAGVDAALFDDRSDVSSHAERYAWIVAPC